MTDQEQPKKTQQEIDELVAAHKRRTALVMYLLILFAVALIFVIISMISQNSKIEKLEDWGDSAVGRAQQLLEENDTLKQENSALKEAQTAADERAQALTEENEQLKSQNEALNEENEALKAEASEAALASDLLLQAQSALASGDTEGFVSAMEALAPYQDRLTSQGQAVYQTLLEAMEALAAQE